MTVVPTAALVSSMSRALASAGADVAPPDGRDRRDGAAVIPGGVAEATGARPPSAVGA
jgi:hypothetical protein